MDVSLGRSNDANSTIPRGSDASTSHSPAISTTKLPRCDLFQPSSPQLAFPAGITLERNGFSSQHQGLEGKLLRNAQHRVEDEVTVSLHCFRGIAHSSPRGEKESSNRTRRILEGKSVQRTGRFTRDDRFMIIIWLIILRQMQTKRPRRAGKGGKTAARWELPKNPNKCASPHSAQNSAVSSRHSRGETPPPAPQTPFDSTPRRSAEAPSPRHTPLPPPHC